MLWEEQSLGSMTVKQRAKFKSEFIEQTKQIAAVAVIGIAQTFARNGIVNAKAIRLIPFADGWKNQAAFFRHADSGETIQNRKRLFPRQPSDGHGRAAAFFGMSANQIFNLVELLLQRDGGLGEEAETAIFFTERDERILKQFINDLNDIVEDGRASSSRTCRHNRPCSFARGRRTPPPPWNSACSP